MGQRGGTLLLELIFRTTTLRSLNYFTRLMVNAFLSYFSLLLRSMRLW
jgi:hypothetical protein